MKQLLSFLSIFLCLSCKVGKKNQPLETHYLHILMDEQVEARSLSSDFHSSGLTELKRTSKSQPLYRARVQLSPEKLTQLMEKLRGDKRVVSVKMMEGELTKTQSTNKGFGVSRPKKKKP